MLSVVIAVVCVVCYCCHRNIKKRSDSIYRQQHWTDNATTIAGANMEVYSVEQCYESSRLYIDSPETTSTSLHHSSSSHSGPPPSYDSVLAMDEFISHRPSPPPKYYQPSRHSNQKCCPNTRQTALNHNKGNVKYCRKHHHHHHSLVQQTLQARASCTCRQSSMNQLNNNSSQFGLTNQHHDSNLNKPVPIQIDSLNNNVNNDGISTILQAGKPLYHHNCQLCGKSQQCPAAVAETFNAQLTTVDADVANGNITATVCDDNAEGGVLCSCDGSIETLRFYQKTNDRLVDLKDAKIQVDSMNNEIVGNTTEMQSTEFIPSSNLNLENSSSQSSQQNHHQQQQQHQYNQREHEQSPSTTEDEPQQHQQQIHNLSTLDSFNENGIIRMDMSQIIDRTGLPTYEAAIKLESSGYV